jgi:Flp pilus assembly protein TadG
MRRPVHGERGASAVEFAFILPLLILLVLGIAEFGHAFQVQGTLSAAAREGVRAMALRNDPAEARDVVQFAAASLNPGITDGQIDITVVGGTGETCPIVSAGDTAVRLTIDYDMPYLTGFFGTGIQLRGTGVMRCNG